MKIKAKTEKKAKSPYQRYGKTPYRYSDLLQDWTRAIKEGKRDLANVLGDRHTRMFGPRI